MKINVCFLFYLNRLTIRLVILLFDLNFNFCILLQFLFQRNGELSLLICFCCIFFTIYCYLNFCFCICCTGDFFTIFLYYQLLYRYFFRVVFLGCRCFFAEEDVCLSALSVGAGCDDAVVFGAADGSGVTAAA